MAWILNVVGGDVISQSEKDDAVSGAFLLLRVTSTAALPFKGSIDQLISATEKVSHD